MTAEEFTRLVDQQREDADHLAALETLYLRFIHRAGRNAASALRSSARTETVTASPWQPPPEGVLFDPDATAAAVTADIAASHRRIFKSVAGVVLGHAGISWDVKNPFARHFLDGLGQRTGTLLGQGVQPVIQETVADAYDRGLSVPDTAALITEKVEDAGIVQARMLARTDLNGLANGASVMAATLVGVEYKQWLTAEDDLVRETHAEADGQTVPVDQPFDVGGESLDYPGDPGGSDAEVCNCRCTVIYVDAADAETASASPTVRVPSAVVTARVPARGFATRPPSSLSVPRMPGRGFAAAVTVTVDEPEPAAPVSWVADLAFENEATGDGRFMLPDAINWADLPIPLMSLTETGPGGHEGALSAGKITQIERDAEFDMDGDPLPDGVVAIRGYGEFDMGGVNGAEAERIVREEIVRGVSVTPRYVEVMLRDPETGETISPADATPDQVEQAMLGELETAFARYTIGDATICPIPAFANARIAIAASGIRGATMFAHARIKLVESSLTASAAGLAPSKPPAAWFQTPEPDEPTPLTVTPEGRVFGHMALWDSCHTGYPGQCVPPPRSPSGYAYFNLGEIECADGSRVAAGALTLDGLHADTDRPLSPAAVRRHYEDTGMVAAFVKAVDGRHGIWVAGTLRADLPERYARDLMGAKPSGDWRQLRPGGPLEMLGVRAVNFPGFPVPRMVAAAMAPSGVRAELQFAEA